jgi:hypothetical protein
MSEEPIPKKILLAEDDESALKTWLLGIQEDGVSLDGRTLLEIIEQAKNDVVIIKHGPHELHITSNRGITP